jgi:hypothetical protein
LARRRAPNQPLWPGIALKHRTVVTEHDPSVAQQLFALTGRELHRVQIAFCF